VNLCNPDKLTSGVIDDLTCIFFIDSLTGYAVGRNGVILKTTNGGLSKPTNNDKNVNLFPNPFIKDITIETNQNMDNTEIYIYNINGKLIFRDKLQGKDYSN
jgi:hypothetical protein